MRVKKTTRAAAVLAALTLAAVACGGNGDTGGGTETAAAPEFTTINDGTLTVCSEIPYPPFEFEDPDTGEFTGFDIDLMQAIADELGLELQVVNTSFEGLQSGATLAAGTCDVAASAMTITEEREQNLDFSEPYFDAAQSLLVKADSGITSLDDLSGRTIGVQAETTGAQYARENAPEDATITEFSSGADAITALQAGQVDAVLQDLGPNAEAARNDESLEVVETYETEEQYGFAVAEEGSEALLEAINQALAELRDNGTYDEIYGQYFPDAAS